MKLFISNIRYFGFRIIAILFVAFLLYLVYFFRTPSAEIGTLHIDNPFYIYVEKLEWWLYLLVYFIIVALINTAAFFVLSLYFNIKNDVFLKIRKNYEVDYSERIINYIYSDFFENKKDENFIEYLKKSAKTKVSQEVLFIVMAKTQELIAEDLSPKFLAIINQLNLKSRLYAFLHSKNDSEKIIALRIISYLRMRGYAKRIEKYSKSDNYVLRNEAMAALIRLSETNHLELLLKHEKNISILDINVIINAVEKNFKANIDYKRLINSNSPRVVIIGLMLIKVRKIKEFTSEIKTFLKSNDQYLNNIAWEVFTSLASTDEDFEYMINAYNEAFYEGKLLIIRKISAFNNPEKIIQFLDNIIKTESIILKIDAQKVILELFPDKLSMYHESKDEQIVLAYREVVDINI